MRKVRANEYAEFAAARARYLYRSACLLTAGDTYLAEDLVQETLGRLYVSWGRVSRASNPAGYAQTVLTRTFLAHQRSRSSTERATDVLPEVAVPSAGGDVTMRLTLVEALAQLPPKDRAVVVLRAIAAAPLTATGQRVSRPEPPLDSARLKTLVTDPAWLRAVNAIPEPAGPGTGTSPSPSPSPSQSPSQTSPPAVEGATILTALTSLLPAGLAVVSRGGQEAEYGYIVVDDGKGKSFVRINVQPDMSDVENELFGPDRDPETLPDGTKVVVRQGIGDDKGLGLVMRTADTIRPDGTRVVISAFNSASRITGPTRENPALTLDQLKAIATSPKWLELVPTSWS